MDFITNVTVGDNTPFDVNRWTGVVEDQDGNSIVRVRGVGYDGAHRPFRSPVDVLAAARALQPERQPGEDIFVITDVTFPDGDGPKRVCYWVAVARCDTFEDVA